MLRRDVNITADYRSKRRFLLYRFIVRLKPKSASFLGTHAEMGTISILPRRVSSQAFGAIQIDAHGMIILA